VYAPRHQNHLAKGSLVDEFAHRVFGKLNSAARDSTGLNRQYTGPAVAGMGVNSTVRHARCIRTTAAGRPHYGVGITAVNALMFP
jgi:hypothetical protein